MEQKRLAEEERLRKAREEEERQWQLKIDSARKILVWSLWCKQMQRRRRRESAYLNLENLDPTDTRCPPIIINPHIVLSTAIVAAQPTNFVSKHIELESHIYRLATTSREPVDLSRIVGDQFWQSSTPSFHFSSQSSYPPIVQTSCNTVLFKLAVVLPTQTSQMQSLNDALHMWINSRLNFFTVSASSSKNRSRIVNVQAVAVNANKDAISCTDCDAALFVLPNLADSSVCASFSEVVLGSFDSNLDNKMSRMVMILGQEGHVNRETEKILDSILGEADVSSGQRHGVAYPAMEHFDDALIKCCETLVRSRFDITSENNNGAEEPPFARVSLANLGFLCLQRLVQNMNATGWFAATTGSSEDLFLTLIENAKTALSTMINELLLAGTEIQSNKLSDWPPVEFMGGNTQIEQYFDKGSPLPRHWHVPLENQEALEEEVSQTFQPMLEIDSFVSVVESFALALDPRLQQNMLDLLDDRDFVNCFVEMVSMNINDEVRIESDDTTMIYLPVGKLFRIIEKVSVCKTPRAPEPIVLAEIPGYLMHHHYTTQQIEMNEVHVTVNTQNVNTSPAIVNKRKSPERNGQTSVVIPDNGGSRKKAKRSRTEISHKFETMEEKKSKDFTSYLEALLG